MGFRKESWVNQVSSKADWVGIDDDTRGGGYRKYEVKVGRAGASAG